MSNTKLLRCSLNKKLRKTAYLSFPTAPAQGWIRTIRTAIGMTTAQLAKRLGVTQPRIVSLEKNEENLKLSTIKKTAEALGCTFVYAMVPTQDLEKMVMGQAMKKARTMFSKTNHNMALESQRVNPDFSKKLLEDLAQELINKTPQKIWDEK